MRCLSALVAIGCVASMASAAPSGQAAPQGTAVLHGDSPSPDAATTVPPSPDAPSTAEPAPPGRAGGSGLEPPTDVTIDRRTGLSAAFGYGGPLGASATLTLLRGLGADVREGGERVRAVCAAPIRHCANGFLVETAAGHRGGRFSVGFGGRVKVEEEDFHGTVGVGLKLSAVRTWNTPAGEEADQTWLGPELDLVVKRVGLGVGLLWPVSGELRAAPRFSWSVGLVL